MGSSEIQGKLWGAKAGDYIELNEPTNRLLWEAMLTAAKVSNGTRFLDAGCGGGGACVLAAKAGAKIVGLDASEALINSARHRVPNGEFRVADIEDLPYADESFDVCFSSLALMFAGNPSRAIQELRRVTTPGGRVVVGVWGSPEDCDLGRVSKAVIDILPPPKPKGSVFSLSAKGLLEELMHQAGLKILDRGEVKCPFEFADFETCWRSLSSAGAMQGVMRMATQETVKEAVSKAVEPLQNEEGVIRLENLTRYVLATP